MHWYRAFWFFLVALSQTCMLPYLCSNLPQCFHTLTHHYLSNAILSLSAGDVLIQVCHSCPFRCQKPPSKLAPDVHSSLTLHESRSAQYCTFPSPLPPHHFSLPCIYCHLTALKSIKLPLLHLKPPFLSQVLCRTAISSRLLPRPMPLLPCCSAPRPPCSCHSALSNVSVSSMLPVAKLRFDVYMVTLPFAAATGFKRVRHCSLNH